MLPTPARMRECANARACLGHKAAFSIGRVTNNPYLLKSLLRLAGVAAVLAGVSVSAQAPLDVRVALIIGNSAYANSPLINPANDARAMGEVLRSLGFQVIELRDGSKAQMSAAIGKVSDALKGKPGVGMLYSRAMACNWTGVTTCCRSMPV